MFSTDAFKRLELGERLVRRNPLVYPEARRVLDELDHDDFTARREWCRDRLSLVLEMAQRTPYGETVKGRADPASWPLLEKHTVRDFPRAFVTKPHWIAAHASTSGTTGTPLKLLRSATSIAFEQAAVDRVFEAVGVDPRTARFAVLRGDAIVAPDCRTPPYWRTSVGGRKLLFSSNTLREDTLEDYVRELRAFAPDVLYAKPTSLETLCVLLARRGLRLPIKAVVLSSEVMRPAAWGLAREVLGCEIVDYYGQAERVAFASAVQPATYRFMPGYSYLEFLPETADPDADGATRLYEIVGTTLWNLTMPLIRYRTGDFVRLPAHWGAVELAHLAHGLRPFEGVIGRDGEVLLAPDGTRLSGMHFIARDVDHILRMQLVQESTDHVELRVLPGPGYSAADGEHLLRNARARIPGNIRVELKVARTLETTAQGKTPLIIHRPSVKAELSRVSDLNSAA